jgi:hypothetical protein
MLWNAGLPHANNIGNRPVCPGHMAKGRILTIKWWQIKTGKLSVVKSVFPRWKILAWSKFKCLASTTFFLGGLRWAFYLPRSFSVYTHDGDMCPLYCWESYFCHEFFHLFAKRPLSPWVFVLFTLSHRFVARLFDDCQLEMLLYRGWGGQGGAREKWGWC